MQGLLGTSVLLRRMCSNAYHATGSVKGIYKYGCDLLRKRMECAIMVAVHRECNGEETAEASDCTDCETCEKDTFYEHPHM